MPRFGKKYCNFIFVCVIFILSKLYPSPKAKRNIYGGSKNDTHGYIEIVEEFGANLSDLGKD